MEAFHDFVLPFGACRCEQGFDSRPSFIGRYPAITSIDCVLQPPWHGSQRKERFSWNALKWLQTVDGDGVIAHVLLFPENLDRFEAMGE